MSLLSMVEAELPPGFRFHPRDDELICDYLAPKASGECNGRLYRSPTMMIDVDLNKCEPWDLPEVAMVGNKEWYFFSLKDRKYASGQRTNRATLSGYWKATGKDRPVVRKGALVGMRKTLVFYQGRAPKGRKTEWVMHEFRIERPGDPPKSSFKEDWVLCRAFYKSRGISTKPSADIEDTGSSSLPPLTDTYITFNQTLPSLEGFEQVPCFSSFPSNPAPHCPNPAGAPHFPFMETSLAAKVSAQLGASPDLGSYLNPLSCDKKVLAAVLNHLTKMEGTQRSSEGCLSETELPSVWNPF